MAQIYVTEAEFQWSLGILISSVVAAMIALFGRVYKSPTRAEMHDDMERAENTRKEMMQDIEERFKEVREMVEKRHAENRDNLIYIRNRLDNMFGQYPKVR